MKKILFPQCFIHHCIFDAIYLQRKKKQSQLLFSILNNYSIYKLENNKHSDTHTHRHTRVHTPLSLFILNAGRGSEPVRAHGQRRETRCPPSRPPS